MKPENAERVSELLQTYQELKQLINELSKRVPGEIGGITIYDAHTDKRTMINIRSLNIDNLGKIKDTILEIIQYEVKEIEDELEKL